jgi:hypothetical protein
MVVVPRCRGLISNFFGLYFTKFIDQTKFIPQSNVNRFDEKKESGPAVRGHWDWHITELRSTGNLPLTKRWKGTTFGSSLMLWTRLKQKNAYPGYIQAKRCKDE